MRDLHHLLFSIRLFPAIGWFEKKKIILTDIKFAHQVKFKYILASCNSIRDTGIFLNAVQLAT